MKKRWLAAILTLLLWIAASASAEWTAPDANLALYQERYGEASEGYKRIRYGAEGDNIAAIKEALSELGFFPYRISNNYYRTLEAAVRIFAGQLRIGGDGSEITPLMQAMLADSANLPRAVSPLIDVYEYSWEPNANTYTPYTYARVTRSSVVQGVKVGLSGKVVAIHGTGGTYTYAIEMENDPEKTVYATYQPLPRTTVFQPGDEVTLFGTTQGEQSFAYAGMAGSAVTIAADRIGYAK